MSTAVTVKLTRTLAIIPITLCLAIYRTHKAKSIGAKGSSFSFKRFSLVHPLFYRSVTCINTCRIHSAMFFTEFYSNGFVPLMKWLATFFISMAMGAIGLNTNIVKLIKSGAKPIILGFCCWIAISAVSIGVQQLTGIFHLICNKKDSRISHIGCLLFFKSYYLSRFFLK